ncbi:erlin-1 [Quercus suber]|uniref:Erlin-1 n=1 Tax=Quercus suber TaxID=58331 RepID=A0AAW0KEB7_QUESU
MKDALQGDCTRYAPGIEIISVRVTKPTIPESIRRNFEQMEVVIAIEKLEAEKSANMSKILMKQQEIENQILSKEAEANKLKLTPHFLELKFIESIAADKKLSFEEKRGCM